MIKELVLAAIWLDGQKCRSQEVGYEWLATINLPYQIWSLYLRPLRRYGYKIWNAGGVW